VTWSRGAHEQYLAKNPNGYFGIGGFGVPFKVVELRMGEGRIDASPNVPPGSHTVSGTCQ
jgi:hypothetical protein